MGVGDLVHVSFDNGHHGIGLIVEMENLDDFRPTYRVLETDGRTFYYFGYELSIVKESDFVSPALDTI